MKWTNAIGFCVMGFGMLYVPVFAPGLIGTGAAASAREWWLICMGFLNTSLGAGVLVWHAARMALRLGALLKPAVMPEPAVAPRRAPAALPEPGRA